MIMPAVNCTFRRHLVGVMLYFGRHNLLRTTERTRQARGLFYIFLCDRCLEE